MQPLIPVVFISLSSIAAKLTYLKNWC